LVAVARNILHSGNAKYLVETVRALSQERLCALARMVFKEVTLKWEEVSLRSEMLSLCLKFNKMRTLSSFMLKREFSVSEDELLKIISAFIHLSNE
jgi:hypothetical protein